MGEQLRQVILTFLTEQGRALPLLEVKQTLEREWVFTKKDYQYKWKRFLESMPLLSIETRVQMDILLIMSRRIKRTYMDAYKTSYQKKYCSTYILSDDRRH